MLLVASKVISATSKSFIDDRKNIGVEAVSGMSNCDGDRFLTAISASKDMDRFT
jgi:hypothetical protein